jgi:predicted enzyme related to lactoylglutathione lyase
VNVGGITWHAIVLEPEPFAATKALMSETFGLAPAIEAEGVVLFIMPNGTMLELHAPKTLPDDGFNEGVVFGFRVDDVEAASATVEAAGCELLGQITRVEELAGFAYRHFRGPDGRVYGLNEQK